MIAFVNRKANSSLVVAEVVNPHAQHSKEILIKNIELLINLIAL